MISVSPPHLLFSFPGDSLTLHNRTITSLHINNNNKTKNLPLGSFASPKSPSLLSTHTNATKQPYPLQHFHNLCNTGKLDKAFNFLQSNLNDIVSSSNLKPDEAIAILLQARGRRKNIQRGRRPHTSRNNNLFHWNNNNIVLWSKLISSYSRNALFYEAVSVFVKMISLTEFLPNNFTLPSVIKACVGLSDVKLGEAVHAYAIKTKLFSDVFVGNALIAMYGKFGVVESALKVFERMPKRNLVSWNSIMYVYSENGVFEQSYGLFKRLIIGDEGLVPDDITMVTVIPLCASQGEVKLGMMLHGLALKLGLVGEVNVSNSLMDMYSKCGYICEARLLFDLSEVKDVVSWSSMITGYSQNELPYDALDMFRQMLSSKVWPDEISITAALGACSQVSALRMGKQLHCFAVKARFIKDSFVTCSLIDMYAKCGCIEQSQNIFDSVYKKNETLWTVLITGYGIHGHGLKAIELFKSMQSAGCRPDSITFIALLMACNHADLVVEGLEYLGQMQSLFGIKPEVKHYECVIDMLGRAGRLNEAMKLVNELPDEPDSRIWSSLLSSCINYADLDIGEEVAKKLLELEPGKPENDVLISNLYARLEKWDEVRKVRQRKGFSVPDAYLIAEN